MQDIPPLTHNSGRLYEYLAALMINVFRDANGHDCEDLVFPQAYSEKTLPSLLVQASGKEEHESVYHAVIAKLLCQQV